ncbi:MAG: cupin domain-containing protein [Lentimicrobium sp.]|nr:cupin domain-containing protein [Lentimicrobium sp.]
MRRGRFILTTISTLLFPFLSESFGSEIQNIKNGFRIKSGESRSGKHLKMKGVTLNVLDLKVSSKDTNGNLSVFEQIGLTPEGGPPLHIHPYQDEYFYVLEGEYLFQVGQERYQLSPGDTIFLPRDVQHAFIQLSERARVLVSYTPAGKMESFFETTDSWTTPPSEDLIKKTFSDHDMNVVGPTLRSSG